MRTCVAARVFSNDAARNAKDINLSDTFEVLGGRLSLFDPATLAPAQKKLYDVLRTTWVPWADAAGFESEVDGTFLIGPFNPILLSPEMSAIFMDVQSTEERSTSLTQRVRQVVILSTGAVWGAAYEPYAHAAAARKAGIPQNAIDELASGGIPKTLSEQERIASRFARRLVVDRHVDRSLYDSAKLAFDERGVYEIVFLAGLYQLVCGLLNAFEIPAPTNT